MRTTTGGSGSSSEDDDRNRSGDDVDDNDPLSETQADGNQGGLISSSNRRNIRNSITTSTNSRGDEESSNRSNRSINTAAAERRRRVLFGVLFRLLVNGRDQRRNNNIDDPDEGEDEDRAQQQHEEEPAPTRPLRILTQSEAESLGAICRICFEGATAAATAAATTTTTNNANPLLSPCNCSGGSQWIHKQCLRQWQRYCTSTNNSRYCNVCQTRYTLRPPRLRTNFDAGNILVYMDTTVDNGTFSKTLVLIVNHRRNHSTFGLIINSPMNQQRQQQIQNDLHIPSGVFDVVSLRRGGPVCGGRLGVTRYIVAHTLPLRQDDAVTSNHINIDDEYVSQPVLQSDPRLHFIYSQDDTTSPTTFDQADLQDIIQKLANLYCRQSSSRSSSSSNNNSISNTTTVTTTTTTTTHLFVFAGYSQWGRGQLCREISRCAWGVCEDGSLDDLIRPLNSNYYDQLISNNDNENSNSNPNPTSAAAAASPSSNGTAASRRLLLGSQLIYEDD